MYTYKISIQKVDFISHLTTIHNFQDAVNELGIHNMLIYNTTELNFSSSSYFIYTVVCMVVFAMAFIIYFTCRNHKLVYTDDSGSRENKLISTITIKHFDNIKQKKRRIYNPSCDNHTLNNNKNTLKQTTHFQLAVMPYRENTRCPTPNR